MASEVDRAGVLDGAAALLRERGPEGLSMRRLADRLGTSTQVVYSRVGGKGDVVRALHDAWFDELRGQVDHATEPLGSRGRVHQVARRYHEHAVADPVRFEVMFGSAVPEFARDDAARAYEWACFRATWQAAVGAWYDTVEPDRPSGTATLLAWRAWTAVHGITTVHLAGHGSPSGDPLVEVVGVVDVLLDSVAPGR